MSRVSGPRRVILVLVASVASLPALAEGVLATIDGRSLSYEEFEQFAYSLGRQTYYHGSPETMDALIEFRKTAADKLVERHLLVREAQHRGFEPDAGYVESEVEKYAQQYVAADGSPDKEMVERLTDYFRDESLLRQIEDDLVVTSVPDDDALLDFWEKNQALFTEPAQLRASIILLSVPAWADTATWLAAEAEAQGIIEEIQGGESFAEMARLRSSDPSAANGGDMGYLHEGALSGPLLTALADLEIGEMTEGPVRVLEGIVIAQLEDRRPPTLRSLEVVRERAIGLWQREASETNRTETVERLRAAADIRLDTEYLEAAPNFNR